MADNLRRPSAAEGSPEVKLRLGLVGLGPSWSTRYKPALQALPGRFEVRAVCDPVAHRAAQAAAELGARCSDGFRTLTASPDVDAVLMLSAKWYGSLPILAACDHAKAMYCGASIDIESSDAQQIRERVRDAGIAFMAELPHRLAPATIRLKELIATRLGPPRLVMCRHRRPAPQKKPSQSQPSYRRMLVEMVDWCRYVVGQEVTSVVATRHSGPTGKGFDHSLVALDFSAPGTSGVGPLAQIEYGDYVQNTWPEVSGYRRPADLQVVCESGVAFVDLPNTLVWFDRAGQHNEALDSERPIGEQLLLHFHRAVASLVLRSSSLDDAYRAITLMLLADQSAAEGRRVTAPAK